MLPLLVSILEDDGVNNLTAKDASPAEKFFTVPVELFVIHHAATFLTFHFRTLLFLKSQISKQFPYQENIILGIFITY